MSDVNIDRNHVSNEKLWIQYSKICLFFVLQYSYQYFISLQQYYSAPLLISPGIFLGPRGILLAAVVNFRLKLPPPLRKLPPPPRPLEKLLPLRPLDVLKIIVWISMIFHMSCAICQVVFCDQFISYLGLSATFGHDLAICPIWLHLKQSNLEFSPSATVQFLLSWPGCLQL